jgi:hypothetical protein
MSITLQSMCANIWYVFLYFVLLNLYSIYKLDFNHVDLLEIVLIVKIFLNWNNKSAIIKNSVWIICLPCVFIIHHVIFFNIYPIVTSYGVISIYFPCVCNISQGRVICKDLKNVLVVSPDISKNQWWMALWL